MVRIHHLPPPANAPKKQPADTAPQSEPYHFNPSEGSAGARPRRIRFATLPDAIEGYTAALLRAGRTAGTAAHQREVLRRFTRWAGVTRHIASLTAREVRAYHDARARSIQPAQALRERYTVAKMLRYAQGLPEPEHPRRHAGIRGIRKIKGSLTKAEETALLRAPLSVKHKLVIRLGLHAGLRCSEMCQLPAAQPPPQVEITLKLRTRHAFLNEELRHLAAQYITGERKQEDTNANGTTLLLTRDGAPADRTDINRWVQIAAKQAGLPRQITSHMLRHTFAARLRESGMDCDTIAGISRPQPCGHH